MKAPHFVSTQWLSDHIDDALTEDFRILQVFYPDQSFAEDMIPNSLVFNGELCSGPGPCLNMMPSPQQFSSHVGRDLGIGAGTHVVIYDDSVRERAGLESAPRLWLLFRAFGHDNVSVLNGGLAKWKAEGRPLTKLLLNRKWEPKDYPITEDKRAEIIVNHDQMLEAVKKGSYHILDSRSEARFQGIAEEPAGGKSGHIEGAVSLPFTNLVDVKTGEIKDEQSLRALLNEVVDHSKPLITTCGVGVTACSLNIVHDLLGYGIGKLYDGSWYEWSRKAGINKF